MRALTATCEHTPIEKVSYTTSARTNCDLLSMRNAVSSTASSGSEQLPAECDNDTWLLTSASFKRQVQRPAAKQINPKIGQDLETGKEPKNGANIVRDLLTTVQN